MKKNNKKVLAFPAPRKEPADSRIVVQIGNDRFAIHYHVEELPPRSQLIWLKPASDGEPPDC
jgi:hypothetical protein